MKILNCRVVFILVRFDSLEPKISKNQSHAAE